MPQKTIAISEPTLPVIRDRMCVIVMGPYRSGTSLVSQLLNGLGVEFGPHEAFQLPADRYNPGGYFQRKDVVDMNRNLIRMASGSLASPPDPETLQKEVHPDLFATVDMAWTRETHLWGVKDPRFSITLLAWVRAGILPADSVRIVRVRRSLDAIARSVVAHKEVGSFCGYDLNQAKDMAERYDHYAGWHTQHLSLPSIEVSYDELVKRPADVVTQLATFMGIRDPAVIDRCVARIGKRRALARYYAHKLIDPKRMLDTIRKTATHWLRGR
jgi:hypothetical protein